MYTFNETVAVNIATHSDKLLSNKEKNEMMKRFENDTTVELPSGHLFSTKTIANNRNKHQHSNKLSKQSKTQLSASQGMINSVNIDLSAKLYTQSYVQAHDDFIGEKDEVIILVEESKLPTVTPVKKMRILPIIHQGRELWRV